MKMIKIKLFIKIIRRKLKIWFIYYIERKRMSTKGLYLCYYIANKYLLNIQPDDYNKEYEEEITITLKHLQDLHLFEKLSIPENRSDAAFFTVIKFLTIATPQDKEIIYKTLKDWPYLSTLKKYVKTGVIL